MAYSRTTWANGDLITAEKLNNLESGILGNETEIAETNGELINLRNEINQMSGLSEDTKIALLQIAQNVAYLNADHDYYGDLYDALYPSIVSISAVFTQGSNIIYETESLVELKEYLTVTALYGDGRRETLSDSAYSLSGTLTAGTSTITVSYGNLTTTFTVTVTADPLASISAVYTQSGIVYNTDTLESLEADLVVTGTYTSGSTVPISSDNYTLSGTLSVGTSTITVTCDNVTTTFSVTVTKAIDYTADAFENVTWYDGYTYNKTTGEMTATSNEHCTSKFTIQNGIIYNVLPNATGVDYPGFFVWDMNDNYIGSMEHGSSKFGKVILRGDRKYAFKTYSSAASISNATMLPVDNRASQSDPFEIDLTEHLDEFIFENSLAQLDLTSLVDANMTKNNYTSMINTIAGEHIILIGRPLRNSIYANSMKGFDNDCIYSIGVEDTGTMNGKLCLQIRSKTYTTLDAIKGFITENHVKLQFNTM